MRRRKKTSRDLLREAVRVNDEAVELKEKGEKEPAFECYEEKLRLMCSATLDDRRGIGWYYHNGIVTVQPREHNRRCRDPFACAPLKAIKSYIANNGFSDEEREILDRRVAAMTRPPRKQKRPGRQLHHPFS